MLTHKLPILTMSDLCPGKVAELLGRYGISLQLLDEGSEITGSYWGEPEAGVIGCSVYARFDTPLHSVLHETCHIVCMDAERRRYLDRDAGGDDLEEAAVCYLQIVLAEYLPGIGRGRLMRDMDAWGYSFRLGGSRAWFETDAADARAWLLGHKLLDTANRPTFRRRF